MNRSELKNLTRDLRALPLVPIPPGLEQRLLAEVPRVRSWRTRSVLAGALATAAVVTIAVLIPRNESVVRKENRPVGPTIAETRAEIVNLQAEMQRTLAIIDRMETRERKAKAEFTIQRFQSAVALERELAATILVMQGDWQRTRGESGVAEYRRVIELFADTSAAAKAKLRLNET